MGRILLATSNNTDEEYGGTYGSTVVSSIPANTYNTYALALAELKTIYDTLTETEKLRSVIRLGDSVIASLFHMSGRYSYSLASVNAFYIVSLSLDTNQYFLVTFGSGPTYSDNSSQAQNMKIDLIIV